MKSLSDFTVDGGKTFLATGPAAFQGSFQAPVGTPASASAACFTGQIQSDPNYVYVCTATNTWKRAALSTW